MKYLLLFIITFFPLLGFGQIEKESSKKVSAEFEEHYNSGEYEKIFELFSGSMKSYLPKKKTVVFLKGIKAKYGNIESRSFTKYEKRTFASYKTQFERAILSVNISVDKQSKINGFLIEPFKEDNLPTFERNTTKLILPFKDEWIVSWGGDSKELNHHIDNVAQKNAFDIKIINEKGKSYKTDGKTNDDYYAFGKELIAPCDAEVVLVVDGVKDNNPRDLNPAFLYGNTVILKTAKGEYLVFAHFKQHSIVVEQGQKVKQAEKLGLCGNSGNSSEAHLHFHIQNVEDMNKATGVKCYFEEIYVGGKLMKDYSPIKSDKVKNK